MTDPGFRVEGIRQAAPFRARAAFGGYQTFSDGNRTVLVEPATANLLRGAAEEAYPMETGGLLSGRILRDSDGQYVLVSGAVQAEPSAGRSAAFEISPQATALLREEAHRAYPTADVVGWWHSHRVPSSYSQTDLNTQTIFTQPESVGLLVFARGEPWAAAYMGPEAKKLGNPAALQAAESARPDENGQAATNPRQDQPTRSIPDPPPPTDYIWLPQGPMRLAVITACVLLLALLLAITVAVLGLPSQIGSAQRQLSGEIKDAVAALPAAASVSYSCIPALASNGQYSGFFNCKATTSVPWGEVKWYLDGKYEASGHAVAIPVQLNRGAHHQIQAILETSAGRYPAPAQPLSL